MLERRASIHRSTGRIAAGSIRQVRTRPVFTELTSPLVSSTRRCWSTAGIDIGRGAASSLTDAEPRLNRSTMTLRWGSASAWKTRSTRCRSGDRLGICLTIFRGQPDLFNLERAGERMTTVSWHVVTSLDGYIAAPGDDMSWVFDVFGPSATVDEIVSTTSAIVMGRRTYEVEDRDRPGIYGGRWKGALFVLTHDPPASVPDWMTGAFVDGVEDAVAKAKAAAGAGKVGLLGASVARQCLDAGLLDEIVVQIAPVLLGDGVRVFDLPGGHRIKLEKTAVAESGRLTDLSFRVVS